MMKEYDPKNPPFLLEYKVEDFFTAPQDFDFEIRGSEYSVPLSRYKHLMIEPFPFLQGVKDANVSIVKVVAKEHRSEALMLCSRYLFQEHLDMWLDAVSYIDERAVEEFPLWEDGEYKARGDPKYFRTTKYYVAVYERFLSSLFTPKLANHVNQQLQTVEKPNDMTVCKWELLFRSACRKTMFLPDGKASCKTLLNPEQRDILLLRTFSASWRNEYARLGHDVSEQGRNHMLRFMMERENTKMAKDAREQARNAALTQSTHVKLVKCQSNNKPSPRRNVVPRPVMATYMNRSTMLTARSSLAKDNSNRPFHATKNLLSDDQESTNTCEKGSIVSASPKNSTVIRRDAIPPRVFRTTVGGLSSFTAAIDLDKGSPIPACSSPVDRTAVLLPNAAAVSGNEVSPTMMKSLPVPLDQRPIPRKVLPPVGVMGGTTLDSSSDKREAPKRKRGAASIDNKNITFDPSSSFEVVCPSPKKRQKHCLLHNHCAHCTSECRDLKRLAKAELARRAKTKKRMKKMKKETNKASKVDIWVPRLGAWIEIDKAFFAKKRKT